jgi:hypothetical protein
MLGLSSGKSALFYVLWIFVTDFKLPSCQELLH